MKEQSHRTKEDLLLRMLAQKERREEEREQTTVCARSAREQVRTECGIKSRGTDKRSVTVNRRGYVKIKRRPRAQDLVCRHNTTSDPSLPDDDDGGEGDGE